MQHMLKRTMHAIMKATCYCWLQPPRECAKILSHNCFLLDGKFLLVAKAAQYHQLRRLLCLCYWMVMTLKTTKAMLLQIHRQAWQSLRPFSLTWRKEHLLPQSLGILGQGTTSANVHCNEIHTQRPALKSSSHNYITWVSVWVMTQFFSLKVSLWLLFV